MYTEAICTKFQLITCNVIGNEMPQMHNVGKNNKWFNQVICDGLIYKWTDDSTSDQTIQTHVE